LHSNQEAVLVLDQEDKYVLAQAIFLWCHAVLGMIEDARLEYSCEIMRSHLVHVRFAGEHCEKIQNIQKKLTVQRGQFRDEILVGSDCGNLVEFALARTLGLDRSYSLCLMVSQRLAKLLVESQRYDGLR
jgi:hypothetical protein